MFHAAYIHINELFLNIHPSWESNSIDIITTTIITKSDVITIPFSSCVLGLQELKGEKYMNQDSLNTLQ